MLAIKSLAKTIKPSHGLLLGPWRAFCCSAAKNILTWLVEPDKLKKSRAAMQQKGALSTLADDYIYFLEHDYVWTIRHTNAKLNEAYEWPYGCE